jgi:hypothetical protein
LLVEEVVQPVIMLVVAKEEVEVVLEVIELQLKQLQVEH